MTRKRSPKKRGSIGVVSTILILLCISAVLYGLSVGSSRDSVKTEQTVVSVDYPALNSPVSKTELPTALPADYQSPPVSRPLDSSNNQFSEITPQEEAMPVPVVVKDDAYRRKLWASLPPPKAQPSAPLSPLPPDEVREKRRQILKYLQHHAGVRSIDVPAHREGQVLNMWKCSGEYSEFKDDYKKHKPRIYFLMAKHLKQVNAALNDEERKVRTSAVGVAHNVVMCCVSNIKDYELAAQVADAYLIPELSNADADMTSILNEYHLLSMAENAYGNAKRYDMEEQVAGRAIELKTRNRNIADTWRTVLAQALKDQGKWDRAYAVLEDIHDPSVVPLKIFYREKFLKEQATAQKLSSKEELP